ncbi:arylsulfatase [Kribbella sp. NPDC049174]|uniref:arylsulfatase n=1 Tax=Kribbella sp. NPDC049174 TaxID=3364112 RepID=UPI00372395DC
MSEQIDRTVLPIRRPPFQGVVNRTLGGSEPDWNFVAPIPAPEGAPNVLLVMTDDAGFGNPSTFGGPISTPVLDRLAAGGLRYNRFHTTALCSPTRAALMTGRNHHAVGFGMVGEFAGPFPGYSAMLPKDCEPFAKTLQGNGYATACFGKWHLTPDHMQGAAGPFDRWPNAVGFDYFWGFLGGESGQFDPVIIENNKAIGTPEQDDFYLPDAMADQAIEWLHGVRAHGSDKRWFAYYSTSASHAPHHVTREWSDKYKGAFDQGWDRLREETCKRQKRLGVIPADAELTPRPDAMPAWDSLDENHKRLYARQMEVYAGYSENADWNIGRVIDAVEEMGDLDNTLIIYIWGDNGASMEGTLSGTFNELTTMNGVPLTDEQQVQLVLKWGGLEAWGSELMAPHYSAAWAWASNTPFQWGKQVASHLGGTRDPMVVHWPQRIKDGGGLRSQFTHINDVGPTILEAATVPQPTRIDGVDQQPMHGTSFLYSVDDPGAAEQHTQQYFEVLGNRAMYQDGWWLSWMMPRIPWKLDPETLKQFAPGVWDPENDPVELYYLPDDFTQARNVADQHPGKVKELQELFWQEAEKYHVLPLLGGLTTFFGMTPPLPTQTRFTYYGDVQNIAPGMIPPIYNHSYTISAELEIPTGGADGVIVAEADHLGGFSLFVQDGKLKHTYSFVGVQEFRQESETRLPTGSVNVRMEFAADAPKPATGGEVTLFVNDEPVGGGRIEHTVPARFSAYAGLDIGRDNGMPVDRSYADKSPFVFAGTVKRVVFDVNPQASEEQERELHEHVHKALAAHAINA